MSTRRHFDAMALVVTALTVGLTIAFMNGGALGIKTVVDADSEAHSDDAYFTDNDLNGAWDASDATSITLDGDGATIVGTGAYAWDGNVTIANSGTFVVSGALEGGSLTVDANANSKVWVMFDGVTISNDDDACLIVDDADKVFLTLAEGSVNSLTSGDSYSEEALSNGSDGTIFAHDDLTINGSGSLDVKAGYKHGIAANDDLVITGGNITVEAPVDAIHSNDSLRICEATIDVTAGDDGLAVDNEGGYLYVRSGTIDVTAGDEGLYAPGDVTIDGGDLTISTGTEQGHHGVKAGGTCVMAGGSLTVTACYEGIQASYIDVSGGDVTVYPTDDGLNASNGGGSDDGMGMMGGGMGGGAGGMGEDGGSIDAEAMGDGARRGMGGMFTELDGVTVDGDTLTITAEGAQNIIADAEQRGLAVSVTADELIACTTMEELMAALGMEGGGMGVPGGGGRGGMRGPMPADATGEATTDGVADGQPGGQGGTADGETTTSDGEFQPDGAGPAAGNAFAPPSSDGQVTDGSDGQGGASSDDATAEGTESAPEKGMQPDMGGSADGDAQVTTASDGDAVDIPWIHVSGGTITVINDVGRDADGLDSNGDIIVTGGDIRVSLLGDGSNSAIDYGSESGGVCEISGGTVVACGGSSMAEGFDSSSTQCSLLYNFSTGAEAGTTVSLVDADGNALLSYEPPCSYTSVNLSCPEMELGGTYQVVIGDMAEEVTLSEVALSSGDTQSSMFGGGFAAGGGMQNLGGPGGGGPRDGSGRMGDGAQSPTGDDPAGQGTGATAEDGDDSQLQPPEGQDASGGLTPQDDSGSADVEGEARGDESAAGGSSVGGPPEPPSGEDMRMTAPSDDESHASSEDGDMNGEADGTSDADGAQGSTSAGDGDGERSFPANDGPAAGKATGEADAGGGDGNWDTPESVDDAVSTEDAAETKEYTTETLVLCGVSVAVLALGLVVALLFRRS